MTPTIHQSYPYRSPSRNQDTPSVHLTPSGLISGAMLLVMVIIMLTSSVAVSISAFERESPESFISATEVTTYRDDMIVRPTLNLEARTLSMFDDGSNPCS